METDKAIFPVEANARGVIHVGPYKEGDVLPVLTVVAVIGKAEDRFAAAGAEAPSASASAPQEVAPAGVGQLSSAAIAIAGDGGKVFASPRARKLAAEKSVDLSQVSPSGYGGERVAERDVLAFLSQAPKATPVAQRMAAEAGVDLRTVAGTGPGGRIVKEDIARVAQTALPAAPAVAPTPAAPLPEVEVTERIPLKGVRGIIAERMGTSVHTTARVTLLMDVDATEFVDVVFSPDGRELAISPANGARAEIWAYEIERRLWRIVVPPPADSTDGSFSPLWSVDGSAMWYHRTSVGKPGTVARLQLDGRAPPEDMVRRKAFVPPEGFAPPKLPLNGGAIS